MDDKMFELITNMYSEMKQQFDVVNKKLDEKANKTDIVKLENDLVPKIEALFDGYNRMLKSLTVLRKRFQSKKKL